MFTRYGLAAPVSALLTLSLVTLMQYLIHMDEGPIEEIPTLNYPEFLNIPKDSPVEVAESKPEPPPPVEPPPQTNFTRDPIGPVTVVSSGVVRPQVGPPTLKQSGLVISDGGAVAIIQARPIYPDRARRAGIEGYVIVEFIVTAMGTVRDAVVVESSNRIFEKAALQAIYKSRYRPQYRQGIAVESPAIRKRFTFELEA